eukprot:CAMPEP_0197605650 /NCGR_PEP_ID=MMETSP1326-20131121/43521_1 /TAXON_ID=1155430 /ORGANISM="Genus nov. species nov., Strain RCC2288" /LENGTH=65 /DNA_ID=CAMNT_0043173475 /DNA_START=487 /DNA_END=680 /DNA_ORIENTATION=-
MTRVVVTAALPPSLPPSLQLAAVQRQCADPFTPPPLRRHAAPLRTSGAALDGSGAGSPGSGAAGG